MDMSSGESMRTTYVVVAHGVHVVLQVTLPVVGEDDAAQFSVTGEVETSVGGKHQQTSHVPPADVFLGRQDAESEDLTLNITHGVRGGEMGGGGGSQTHLHLRASYLTDSHLHDGVEAPLWRVQVP